MSGDDLIAPHDPPEPEQLDAWRAAACTGAGTPWLSMAQAVALAKEALSHGEGVKLMEASTLSFREPPRDVSWEILGDDPDGQNWDDHHDPARAYFLLQSKLKTARLAGATLQYKIWLAKP